MNTPDQIVPATLSKRLASYLMDNFLFYLTVYAAIFIVLLGLASSGGNAQAFMGMLAINGAKLVLFALWTLYFVVFEWRRSATLGKRIMGCRVVDHAGHPISGKQAIVRNIASIVNWLTFGGGFLLVAFRRDRRGLHDILAGTRVVHADPANTKLRGWGVAVIVFYAACLLLVVVPRLT